MRKLESKRRHFFPLQNRYGHGRTGRTIAAGPEMYTNPANQSYTYLIMLHFGYNGSGSFVNRTRQNVHDSMTVCNVQEVVVMVTGKVNSSSEQFNVWRRMNRTNTKQLSQTRHTTPTNQFFQYFIMYLSQVHVYKLME